MPKYDYDNAGTETRTLFGLKELIADTPEFQEVSESPDAVEAKEKIWLGVMEVPWDGNEFTEQQIAEQFCRCQLYPNPEGGRIAMPYTDAAIEEGGQYTMCLWRYVRDTELSKYGRNDMYLWFWDLYSKLEQKICTDSAPHKGRVCPRLNSLARQLGPAFNPWDTESARGAILFGMTDIEWGGPYGGGGGGEE